MNNIIGWFLACVICLIAAFGATTWLNQSSHGVVVLEYVVDEVPDDDFPVSWAVGRPKKYLIARGSPDDLLAFSNRFMSERTENWKGSVSHLIQGQAKEGCLRFGKEMSWTIIHSGIHRRWTGWTIIMPVAHPSRLSVNDLIEEPNI